MKRHLDKEIEQLKCKSLALGALVEGALDKAAAAVIDRNHILAAEVVASDVLIDAEEVNVEEDCLKILALHQPVATDLRYVIAILKLNNDLERIGDLAVNIAEQAVALSAADSPPEMPSHIGEMVTRARAMVRSSLDSLVNINAAEARRVCIADDVVDDLHRSTYAWFIAAVGARPEHASLYTCYLSASRYLERIADHATNIAEDVIYMTEGDIVRHSNLATEPRPTDGTKS